MEIPLGNHEVARAIRDPEKAFQVRCLECHDTREIAGIKTKTDADLDNVIGVGTGVMVFANIPICWLFGYQAMRAYKEYVGRLKSGRMRPDHSSPGR